MSNEKEIDTNAWRFVEDYYPNYDHCDNIAYAGDLQKLLDKEGTGDCVSDKLLVEDYGGDWDNPQIKIDYESVHYDIYERAIQGFLERENKVEEAKEILKKGGYYVDNLWSVPDVMDRYECDEDTAQEVLDTVMQAEYTVVGLHESIAMTASDMNLKEK